MACYRRIHCGSSHIFFQEGVLAMIVGIPKEIKPDEGRVAAIPAGVEMLCSEGHRLLVQQSAGWASGFSDEEYQAAGAEIVESPEEVFSQADLILKVKEPLPPEYPLLREEQIIFTFLHLAPLKELGEVLREKKVTAVGYETVDAEGYLPLLTPMSEIAGKMAIQTGARFMEKIHGGRGILIGGVPGVPAADIVIIGGGVVGKNAARVALGMGAQVTVVGRSPQRLRELSDLFGGGIITFISNNFNLSKVVQYADLLISAVLVPGARAPSLISEEMVSNMKKGSVILDVAIDQGGAVETIDQETTHAQPTYKKHGVIHYAVPNMPGAVPRTATISLTNATLPYAQALANKGVNAFKEDPTLAKGVNVFRGEITNHAVAEAQDLPYVPLEKLW